MNQPRFDRDRMLLYTVLLSGLVGIGLYVTLYLTIATYGALNEAGVLVGRVALYVTTGTLIVALVLALTARSESLSSTALSGLGWFLVFGGIALLLPTWAASASTTATRGIHRVRWVCRGDLPDTRRRPAGASRAHRARTAR